MTRLKLVWLTLVLATLGALPEAVRADPPQLAGVEIDEAWKGLSFSHPVLVTHAKDGSGTVYVVERSGRVYRLPQYAGEAKAAQKQLFLDLSGVIDGFKNAQGGLLSVAFHPQYQTNRRFFVASTRKTTAEDQAVTPENKFMLLIEEYRSDGERAVGPGKALLAIRKKTALHQAGDLAFGRDGKLYISVGDDAEPHTSGAFHKSQDMLSPLGKVLRIDVDAPPTGSKQYAIPADNPWPRTPKVLPEIFAYGLRNPWRISFDPRGRLWTTEPGTSHKVTDVPGKTQEWVTQVVRAGNHGWPFFEGERNLVVLPPSVSAQSLIPKTFAYQREGEESTAGIGGYVYRGRKIDALRDKYVFGDFGRGHVYAIDLIGSGNEIRGTNWKLVTEMPNIASLGEDEGGELYLCSAEDEGWIAVLVPGG